MAGFYMYSTDQRAIRSVQAAALRVASRSNQSYSVQPIQPWSKDEFRIKAKGNPVKKANGQELLLKVGQS